MIHTEHMRRSFLWKSAGIVIAYLMAPTIFTAQNLRDDETNSWLSRLQRKGYEIKTQLSS